jgi:hypothetical protein
MNGILQGEDELREALERLSGIWVNLCSEWDDNAQKHFQSAYVTPVLNTTAAVLAQAQHLSALIDQARNSVE